MKHFRCKYSNIHPVMTIHTKTLVDDEWIEEIKEDEYCDCEFRNLTLEI